jgi:hypothetical protein
MNTYLQKKSSKMLTDHEAQGLVLADTFTPG